MTTRDGIIKRIIYHWYSNQGFFAVYWGFVKGKFHFDILTYIIIKTLGVSNSLVRECSWIIEKEGLLPAYLDLDMPLMEIL